MENKKEIKETCVIIAGGELENSSILSDMISKQDFVICADKGFLYAQQAGIKVDFIIGDFDSFNGELPGDVKTKKLKCEKQDTDLLSAIKEGINRGFRFFKIFAATGGRIDHTFAAISCLEYLLNRGCFGEIVSSDSCVFAIKNTTIDIPKNQYKYLSVFAFGGVAESVTLKGVKYPLCKSNLDTEFPLGISNCIEENIATVCVEKGKLLIMLTEK